MSKIIFYRAYYKNKCMYRLYSRIFGITVIILFTLSGVLAGAAKQVAPNDQKIIATVGDDQITLDDLNNALASLHDAQTLDSKAGPIDYSDILQRIINTRLILFESRDMGLYDTSEIVEMVKKFSQEAQMEMLLEEQVKNIREEQNEVDRLYQGLVKEWKIKTVLIKKEDDAKKIESDIKANNDFEGVVKKALSDGIAEGGEEQFVRDADLTQSIAQLVSTMETGSVSPVVPVESNGFVIFKLEGYSIPEKEDTGAMKTARQEALDQARVAAAKKFYQDLKDRYVEIKKDLFASIDYESKDPGFEKLKDDTRVLARIKGEKPITVGDLTKALEDKFYHGVENAIKEKKINTRKEEVLEGILERRLLLKEASRRGIEKTEALRKKVKAYEDSMVFGLFVNRAIDPDIRITQDELMKYYEDNIEKYTTPMMLAIKGLAFHNKKDANDNLESLRKGTDFTWLSSRAEGQIDKRAEGLMAFDGNIVSLKNLPEELQGPISGAKSGDYMLYTDSKTGYFYVLYISKVVSPKPQQFDNVKEAVAKAIFDNKQKKALEDWAEKLKAYYPVKIYQTDLMKSH